jgi:predicted small secreted protein
MTRKLKKTVQMLAPVLGISITLALVPFSAAQEQTPDEIESVVYAFAEAMNDRDANALYSLLSSQSQSMIPLEEFQTAMELLEMEVEIVAVQIIELTETSATSDVTATASYLDPYGNPISETSTQPMYFVKENGVWKIDLMGLPPEEPITEEVPTEEIYPEEVPTLPEYVEVPENTNLTASEVVGISETDPEIAEFLQRHPAAEGHAFYDSYSGNWFVNFWEEKSYAQATVDDKTGEVFDVYVYEWPPVGTNLTEDVALQIAGDDDRVSGFLTAHPEAQVSVWYDEWGKQWIVSFWDEATFEFMDVIIDDATGTIVEIWPEEIEANLTSDQAINIAKQDNRVQGFLADHPDAVEFAYYESYFQEWIVTFSEPYAPVEEVEFYVPEMVTVFIDDLTGTIKEVYLPPKISEAEAIQIAKSDPEMSEFLTAYPDAEVWAWSDQKLGDWVVTAYAPETWEQVTVFVDAQTGEIKIRVAEIDWEQALNAAKVDEEVSEFLATNVITSVHIFYDEMTNRWFVDFSSDVDSISVQVDAATGEVLEIYKYSWAEELTEFPEAEISPELPPI